LSSIPPWGTPHGYEISEGPYIEPGDQFPCGLYRSKDADRLSSWTFCRHLYLRYHGWNDYDFVYLKPKVPVRKDVLATWATTGYIMEGFPVGLGKVMAWSWKDNPDGEVIVADLEDFAPGREFAGLALGLLPRWDY
jgi:hypothetical protein